MLDFGIGEFRGMNEKQRSTIDYSTSQLPISDK